VCVPGNAAVSVSFTTWAPARCRALVGTRPWTGRRPARCVWMRSGRNPSYRRRATKGVDSCEKHFDATNLHIIVHSDVAQMPTAAGGADGLHNGLLGSDCLDHGVSTKAASQFLDLATPSSPRSTATWVAL
jgi:hypothetical protein